MRRIFVLLLNIGLLFTGPVQAARWQTYDVESGLVGMKVFAMLQDHAGYIWFGTLGGGICRYDGQTWESFTVEDGLSSNDVWALFQDANGTLWIGTEVGLDQFKPSPDSEPAQRVTNISKISIQPVTLPPHMQGKAVRTITTDPAGTLWIGTEGAGLARFDGKTWQTYTTQETLMSNQIYTLYADSSAVWVGTDQGLCRFLGNRFEPINTFDNQAIYAIYKDASRSIWIGAERGIYREEPQKEFKQLQRTEQAVRAIAQDEQGRLWFGTYGKGATQFDGHTWTPFTRDNTDDGLPHNWVMSLLKDKEGHLWFGTNGGGVSQYDDLTFEHFTQKNGLASDLVVSSCIDKEGHLWFGTDGGGVSKYDGKTWKTFTTSDGLANNSVRTIVQDSSGNMWFGTSGGGVSKYDGKTWKTFTTDDGLASNRVLSAFVDQKGQIWFGTGSFDAPGAGVSCYDNKTWKTFTTSDGLGSSTIYVITQTRDGNLWFGTDNGASYCKASASPALNGQIFQTLNISDNPEGNKIQVIIEDPQGHLWFGTDGGGVIRTDGTQKDVYTKKNGLTSNQIRSGLWDQQGHLWFGTLGGGAVRYDGQVVQTLTQRDGLAHNAIYDIRQDRSGAYWFSTLGGGVTRYKPWRASPPQVVFDNVVASRRYAHPESLRVPSSVGLVAFEFHGISFKTRPDALVYRYRLTGHDSSWLRTTKRRVEYQDLLEGNYVFQVQSVDRDMVYSDSLETVTLTIYHQPFTSSVGISALDVQNIFASYYKTYANDILGIGQVTVTNEAPEPVEATISFYLPGLMDLPTEKSVVLKGKQTQTLSLGATIRPEVLDVTDTKPIQAEVALSYKANEQTVSVKAFETTQLYGQGALTWDTLGRAAAFVTPRDPRVDAFARGLYDGFRHHIRGTYADGNIPTAMLMFEALNAHGIHYAQDASSPYAKVRTNQFAVDNIQYPAQLLNSRLGDCDDCTVLYCSLLENLNIATAFVDAPDHILMLFDSGVTESRALGFSLSPDRYIVRDGRFWIPVEVTVLGEGSFMRAWELGAETCLRLLDQKALHITDVRTAWTDYPLALPNFDLKPSELPDAIALERTLQADLEAFQQMRRAYINTHYLMPLLENPNDQTLRMDLARIMIESEDYKSSILALMPLLTTDYRAEAYYLVGYAYAALKDYDAAIKYMAKAVSIEPTHEGYSHSLDVLKRARDRRQGTTH